MKCPIEVNISERDVKRLLKMHKQGIEGTLYPLKDCDFMDKMCEVGLCYMTGNYYAQTYSLTRIGSKLIKDYTNP